MNKERRKQIDDIIAALESNRTAFDALALDADSITQVRDDEQEYKDNMPSAMQDGQKGSDADEAISQLDSAAEAVQSLLDALDNFNLDDVLGMLQSAKGA